jgi:hypothetical protein
MKRNFLKDLGLEDEVVDKIMAENGNDINNEKAKAEVFKNDLKVKETLVEELNTKISDLSAVDIEKLKTEQFELGKSEGTKEVENFKKSNALKTALATAKTKDVDLLAKLLDESKIEYENADGNYTVKGIEDQLKTIQESKPFLFDLEEQGNQQQQNINLGGNHSNNGVPNLDTMSYDEYKKYRKDN